MALAGPKADLTPGQTIECSTEPLGVEWFRVTRMVGRVSGGPPLSGWFNLHHRLHLGYRRSRKSARAGRRASVLTTLELMRVTAHPEAYPPNVTVDDLRVVQAPREFPLSPSGERIFVGGPVPMEVFSPDAYDTGVQWEVGKEHAIVYTLTNRDARQAQVNFVFFGQAVK